MFLILKQESKVYLRLFIENINLISNYNWPDIHNKLQLYAIKQAIR
jgi:hypothetical protein